MKKIFIDGGANIGQSTRSFLKQWPESETFEIYMFEPKPTRRLKKTNEAFKNVELLPAAVWIYDGEIDFFEKATGSQGNTLIHEKTIREPTRKYKKFTVKAISLSNWIKTNFSREDYIILKLDVEGAEYEIIEDLYQTGVLEYIDMFFCEIHGLKCGKDFKSSKRLVEMCEEKGLTLYCWGAETFKYKSFKSRYYSDEKLKKEFKKWKERGLK